MTRGLHAPTRHSATLANQRKVFEAREADAAFKKREVERAKEVAQERERDEHRR